MKQLLPQLRTFSSHAIVPRSIWTESAASVRRSGASRWICHECRAQGSRSPYTLNAEPLAKRRQSKIIAAATSSAKGGRQFTTSRVLQEQTPQDNAPKATERLPSHDESKRSDLSKRLTSLMDHMQSNIFIAGQRLNDLTGYSGIEALKKDIEKQENLVASTRNNLQSARAAYFSATDQRSASQREVNDLLQRKNSWSPADLERFTSLYRSDHANEQAESSAREAVAAGERAAEEASAKLSASILARYHEEQIWSDKIRRMSTWGTWGLMGVNVLLFLVFQIGVEPWRRKRLVRGFEEKVVEALEKEGIASNVAIAALREAQQTKVQAASVPVVDAGVDAGVQTDGVEAEGPQPSIIAATEAEVVEAETPAVVILDTSEPAGIRNFYDVWYRLRDFVTDLFSPQVVSVRKFDLTAASLEGAFTGIALTAMIAAILRS